MRTRLLIVWTLALVLVFSGTSVLGNTPHGVRVVVLDAGHGGWDPGAHYAGAYEKTITLKVVLRLGKLIEEEMPGVKVYYTRTTDKALAQSKRDDLMARANFANRMEGDLFISVHVNAATSPAARGVETLVMGETPLEQRNNHQALLESNRDDLIDMSDEHTAAMVRAYIQNLQFTYGEYSMALAQCIQNSYRQDHRSIRKIKPQPLMVLYRTNMPGVLTEIGFLSNSAEAAYLKSERGVNEVARALLRAVKEYSRRLSALRGDSVPAAAETQPARTETQPAAKPAVREEASKSEASPVRYTVQVMASDKRLSTSSRLFKSYRGKVREYTGGGKLPYKYCVGEFSTEAQARSEMRRVRQVFRDAFVVRCRDRKIVK